MRLFAYSVHSKPRWISETIHFASPTPVLVDPILPPSRTFSVSSASFRSATCRTSN